MILWHGGFFRICSDGDSSELNIGFHRLLISGFHPFRQLANGEVATGLWGCCLVKIRLCRPRNIVVMRWEFAWWWLSEIEALPCVRTLRLFFRRHTFKIEIFQFPTNKQEEICALAVSVTAGIWLYNARNAHNFQTFAADRCSLPPYFLGTGSWLQL